MEEKVGTTYWITGLSGAGKTTIGTKLYKYIKQKKDNVVLLDGDILRGVYQDYSYDAAGRIKLTYRDGRMCQMLNNQDIDVIICTIGMYDECRDWNRKNIKRYREIYLNVPIDELIKRDKKGLYSRALRNEEYNVMGINMDYEAPKNPDIEINNSGLNTPKETVDFIVKMLEI